ncbi:MAG TPA: bifunctional [glutamine synthetase] adenylyltransferase/[glutamine synthetase]-adenylyl-L-tyrosine phosphorylase [Caulobacteraceae bacterium]|jgi:glutamate-ammonia-ligase adenylyltransferase|nr:bifunctional [glutamine synthetase] adenylyltransferase/[glutamine synthetase]-adenylyl-L-tyrosine phosphorylase [Caulobacteraceae bacterium]
MAEPLAALTRPCGPITNAAAAERAFEILSESAAAAGWRPMLDQAWPALAPVFAASPYLSSLARRSPERLRAILETDAETRLDDLIDATLAVGAHALDLDAAKRRLRLLKSDAHLLAALADLGDLWSLEAVTGALTRFADATVTAALCVVAHLERERGRLLAPAVGPEGPIPGLFGFAMGKWGAGELNYSSDIDLSLFYEPEALQISDKVEPQAFVDRCAQTLASLLSERTAEGYVFRVDLRLRPDPSTTPPVVRANAALHYYETVGQNWERAAFIKARPVMGDAARARAFLKDLEPFVWRRSLDYAAISDVHSIKRQIHVHRADERLEAAGANLKLGAGGIREIEFFVQTQQLILGGRDRGLRSPRTLDALQALRAAGHVLGAVAGDLTTAYRDLRAWEHRIQMLEDEQTHTLPEDDEARTRVAALSSEDALSRFDARVSDTLKTVNRCYGELFAEAEPLSSPLGSLVFTGVDDDPETLATLAHMGFSNPHQVAATIRAWHHGRIPATRTERGRELFTRLAPKLLETVRLTGAPDAAFARFAAFFSALSSGVQIQSLFLAHSNLFDMLVEVMAFSPKLASTLARRPAALDAVLDRDFFAPLGEDSGVTAQIVEEAARGNFEESMDAVRRIHREQAFRIGFQIISGTTTATIAGEAYADLAQACVRGLAPAALKEAARIGGALAGDVAVLALGKLGSREMTAMSDLDLMTIYAPGDPNAVSLGKGWAAETFFSRFTQRLIAALSAPTAEGELYTIDMQLRPSGAKGPVAVTLNSFERYYAEEADTWEMLALTRARVVWSTTEAFGAAVSGVVDAALRRPRDRAATASDVLDMRRLMERERPPYGFWDMKRTPGGLIDAEFAAQFLQIAGADPNRPLRRGVLDAFTALVGSGEVSQAQVEPLAEAWALQQGLAQLARAAVESRTDPSLEPEPYQRRLARAGGCESLMALEIRLTATRARARAAFLALVVPPDA